jgi:Domain of unknown function (DUF1905)/Bacteriocin-protection, YdeI or OmpD-Associated
MKSREETKASRGRDWQLGFEATLLAVGGRTILRVPEAASNELPSRGQVAVRGALNGKPFEAVIEPDGNFGHWMSLEPRLQKSAGVHPGDLVRLEVEPAKEWPEPKVPSELGEALSSAPRAVQDLWRAITPAARWEWVRWIDATKNPGTRERRVSVSISKMRDGKRRPCCFNLASCTDAELSKSGKLVVG